MTHSPVKILVSVGTQFAFDRLIQIVDDWAAFTPQLRESIMMQVGPGGKLPAHARSVEFLTPMEYSAAAKTAEVLVAHAGIGSILTAIELGLPVIIFPRSFALGEHRNDHQSSTAREFSLRKGVYLANSAKQLMMLLDNREKLEFPECGGLDESFSAKVEEFIKVGLNE
ncbi:glycosyltransferase [Thalassolituus sp.]|jgi:UDP-N-acetylglucosamine transferase subunit ALG13|uniref:glycosyltransferase n=1 Tax=Thalassolituus sp. TaxID=2030822 RepID=UPI0032D99F33